MMREYDVEECSPECGACRVEKIEQLDGSTWRGWVLEKFALCVVHPTTRILLNLSGRPHGQHCPACGIRVGIDEDGRPWRERMVPESALEWLAFHAARMSREASGDSTDADKWVRAALKHAEEDRDED